MILGVFLGHSGRGGKAYNDKAAGQEEGGLANADLGLQSGREGLANAYIG